MQTRDPKVTQIKELIHQGNLRDAMRKCNSQIQKTERSKFYALKALVLQKLKKVNECLEIVGNIRFHASQDLEAMEILIIIFKNLRQFKEVTDLYEEIYQKNPSEERGKKLYQSYSNQFKLADQSKLALSLHKTYKKIEYAEMSVLAMLVLADLEPTQQGMVEIADLLFKKIKRDENFAYNPNFFKLDLEIKLRLRQYREAITITDEYPEMLPDAIERTHTLAKLHRQCQNYYESFNLFHSILAMNLEEGTAKDLQQVYEDYLVLIFDIIKNAKTGLTSFNTQNPIDPASYAIKALDSGPKNNLWKDFTGTETLSNMIMASLANIKGTRDAISGRGPIVDLVKKQSFLIEFEYKRRLIFWNFSQGNEEYKEESDTGAIFMNLLYKYISLHYEIVSTPDDLVPFFSLLNTSQFPHFKEKLEVFHRKMIEISANKIKCLKCTLTIQKIFRLIGVYSPPYVKNQYEAWQAALAFYNMYQEYSQFEVAPKKNEIKLSDEFLLLAVEILLQKLPGEGLEEEKHHSLSQRVLFCIVILTQGLEQSSHNNAMKFKLMQLHELNGNSLAVENLFSSIEMKANFLEKQSFIFFRCLAEKRIHSLKLVDTCEAIKQFHRGYHSEQVPFVQRAYSQNNINEIKSFYHEKQSEEKSFYLVLAQYEMFNHNFIKNVHLNTPQLSRVMREGLSFLNFASKLPNLSHFSLTPDPSILYFCGSVAIKPVRDVRLRTPYNTEQVLAADPYAFRLLCTPEQCYGLYADVRYLRLEALKLKLVLDVFERNLAGIDSGLRAFHAELYDLELLDKPTLAKGLSFRPSTIFSTLPGVKELAGKEVKHDEEIKEFDGKFETEDDFWEHSKTLEGYFWKFKLMLFEGAFRLLCAHPAIEVTSKGKQKEPANEFGETELTHKLTSYPHIIRHFEILTLMLRDLETQIVPKEDYLKKLKLGLSNIMSNMDVDPEENEYSDLEDVMYPLMSVVIGKFILGPIMIGALMVNSFAQFLPNKEENTVDLNSVINLYRVLHSFDGQLRSTIEKVKGFLNTQKNLCYYEKLVKEYMNNYQFKQFTTDFNTKMFQKAIVSLKANKDADVNACLGLIASIERIPVPSFI